MKGNKGTQEEVESGGNRRDHQRTFPVREGWGLGKGDARGFKTNDE